MGSLTRRIHMPYSIMDDTVEHYIPILSGRGLVPSGGGRLKSYITD
jgi:hypothetical protein